MAGISTGLEEVCPPWMIIFGRCQQFWRDFFWGFCRWKKNPSNKNMLFFLEEVFPHFFGTKIFFPVNPRVHHPSWICGCNQEFIHLSCLAHFDLRLFDAWEKFQKYSPTKWYFFSWWWFTGWNPWGRVTKQKQIQDKVIGSWRDPYNCLLPIPPKKLGRKIPYIRKITRMNWSLLPNNPWFLGYFTNLRSLGTFHFRSLGCGLASCRSHAPGGQTSMLGKSWRNNGYEKGLK